MKFRKVKSTIILLDLSMWLKDLEEICTRYGLDFELIKYNKINLGVKLLWIDLGSNIIAFTANGLDGIRTNGLSALTEMKPEEAIQIKELPVILDTDSILDKINEYGIESLIEEEKEYLKGLK